MPEEKPEELAPPSLASLLLSDFERDALAHHQELKKTKKRELAPLSPSLEADLYEVFLLGCSCEDIAKNNPGISHGQVLEARLDHDWDARRSRYIDDLLDNAKPRMQQTQLEAIEFLRTQLGVVHRAMAAKAKKYVQTGKPGDLPKFTDDISWGRYKQMLEMLMKLTGQPDERKQLSGTVTHQHNVTVTPGPEQPKLVAHQGGMPAEDAAAALAAIESLRPPKKHQ